MQEPSADVVRPEENRNDPGFLDIADPDEAIYRIFPLWFLEEALRLRQLVLVPRTSWEDPYEVLEKRIAVNVHSCGVYQRQVMMGNGLPQAFAQCWSATPESDTLLRAYSRVVKDTHFQRNTCPRDEGVRVRSTPRKLLEALRAGTREGPSASCFIGSVHYLSQTELMQSVTNVIGQIGLGVFAVAEYRARLMLQKRTAFSHEAEVRLIYVEHQLGAEKPLLRVQIDPNEVFEEITFDPRLVEFERLERETAMRSMKYAGAVNTSDLYQPILMEVMLDIPNPLPAK
jgi:hypothetical protein